MTYTEFGRKNKRALIHLQVRIITLFPYNFKFLQKVVYRTTIQGAEYPLEAYDFFNPIPSPVSGLRKFPTYRPCTSPMAAKRHPNKTLMNHVFFVHQMSGCLICCYSTFRYVHAIFTFAWYGNTLLIGGDHNVFIHQ